MKKVLALVLTVIMTLSLFAGCKSTTTVPADTPSEPATDVVVEAPADTKEDIALSIWVLEEKADSYKYAKEKFEAENPGITIEVVSSSIDAHKQNLKVAASSKTLPSMWYNWGGSLGSFYTLNGLTYNMNDYAAANNWSDKFQKAAMDLCTFDGQLAGYPLSMNMISMYYNKAVFNQYGIEIPTTFSELESVCQTLKANGVTPFSTGGKYGWHVMRYLEQLIEYYAGAETHDKLSTFNTSWSDNEAVNNAFAKFKEFSEKAYFPEGFVTADPNDARALLYSGQAAMQLEGPWFDGNIVSDEQDINNFGCFPFPSSDVAGEGRMSAFAEMVQLNANLSDAELGAAIKFLNFYTSDTVVNEYTNQFTLPLPVIGARIPEDKVNVGQMVADMDMRGIFTITDQAFPTEVADVLFAAQDAVATGAMEANQAGSNLQSGIETYLANNK